MKTGIIEKLKAEIIDTLKSDIEKMVARQFSNTKSALEMAKVGGANKKWQEMMATLWSPQKNNTQVTTNGHGWWHS